VSAPEVEEDDAPDKPTTRAVCAGQRAVGDDKPAPAWKWFELDAEGNPITSRPLVFSGKGFRDGVGMVFEASTSGKRAWRKFKYLGALGDVASPDSHAAAHAAEICAQWKAEEAAARVLLRAEADERKGKSPDWIDELLNPQRDAYTCADPLGREVIVAQVIRRITRGR
jgi:hypothetical protein